MQDCKLSSTVPEIDWLLKIGPFFLLRNRMILKRGCVFYWSESLVMMHNR
jgi:hypothetical protein